MKKVFKMELRKHKTGLCDTLVILAAQSNGGKPITLNQLKTVAEGNILQYPSLYSDTTPELIGDNILHIDVKVGENYETVCVIEEVEVWDMEETVPDENVVLQRHLN